MEMMTENKMGVMPIKKLLITMSLPAMFSMLVQALYNIVDSAFVAQISEDALTAVSLAFPIQILLVAIGVGTGVGVNSLISRRLGEKRFEEANQTAEHGIVIGVVNWVIFLILGLTIPTAFLGIFEKNPALIQMGSSYLTIVMTCSLGAFVEFNISKTLQSTGNMFYPMICQLIGAITNIILDPILIFGLFGFPKLGVAGAAIATVIGQTFAMLVALYALIKKQKEVKVKMREFRPNLGIIKDIYKVGIPSIVMQAIASIMITCMNGILVVHGKTAVAFLSGIYYKVQSFVFMPVFGLTQGAMPIMGYNYGAKNKKRLMETIKFTLIIAFGIMFAGMLLFLVFPKEILMIFKATDEMYRIGIPGLRILSGCFIFAAMGIVLSTVFQAIGHGIKSMILSILRQLVVIIPVAYVMSKSFGLEAVWYAFIIAEIITIGVGVPMLIKTLKQEFAIWKGKDKMKQYF